MNRRELLAGIIAAAAAASIPIPALAEQYGVGPGMTAVRAQRQWLEEVRQQLFDRIINPPCILNDDGTMIRMSTEADEDMLGMVMAYMHGDLHGLPA